MMARTTREQIVSYVAPILYEELEHMVEAGIERRMRVTMSSLIEDMLEQSLTYARRKYLGPTHGASRRKKFSLA